MEHNTYNSPFNARYASKEMQYIYSPDFKFKTWRKLWIALAEAEHELGLNVTQEQIDELIGMYFTEGCNKETRIKIYCYIAAGGLLWSNWCEYKRNLGVDFGEYSLRQYRYAKDYYKIFMEETNEGR